MQPVSSKVAVGATSATATTAPMVIIIWLLSLVGIPAPPPEVLIALAGLAAGAGSLIGGYIKRELNLPGDPAQPETKP